MKKSIVIQLLNDWAKMAQKEADEFLVYHQRESASYCYGQRDAYNKARKAIEE